MTAFRLHGIFLFPTLCLTLFLTLAGPATLPAQDQPPAAYTAIILEAAALTSPAGEDLGEASPGQALEAWERRGERLRVRLPGGREAWLPVASTVVLAGPPAEHAPRLARLAAANISAELRPRLLAGRIAAGDNQWQVELAWGKPWRSFMVNLFRDEEHYVYRAPDGQHLLLRFKGGQLQALPQRESLAVESIPPPR